MRSMYLQFGKNRENNIQSQINELNTMVVEECARIVIPNIQQQQGYIDDITSGIKIMPWAQNVSNNQQLEGPASRIPNPETAQFM
jgi:hypothetical protein